MYTNENNDVRINDTVALNDNAPKYNNTYEVKNNGNVKMPSKGGHLTMLIFCFVFGALWGILSISPYTRMKNAIEAGDEDAANANAKKIKLFFFIGLVVNIVYILITLAK